MADVIHASEGFVRSFVDTKQGELREELLEEIGKLGHLEIRRVTTRPPTGGSGVLYLVPSATSKQENIYDEYLWINGAWEMIGSTAVDLSGYVKKDADYDAVRANAATGAEHAGKPGNPHGTTASDIETENDGNVNDFLDRLKDGLGDVTDSYWAHKDDETIHVTSAEKQKWNAKLDPDAIPTNLANPPEGKAAEAAAVKTAIDNATKLTPVLGEWTVSPDSPQMGSLTTPARLFVNEYGEVGCEAAVKTGGTFTGVPDRIIPVSEIDTGTEFSTMGCVFVRSIVGYTLVGDPDSPTLVPVEKKEEGGKTTYELPPDVMAGVFATPAFKTAVDKEIEEHGGGGGDIKYDPETDEIYVEFDKEA